MFEARYASLTFYKAYADLRAESEKYYISYLWWIIEPILNMCIYYMVFGVLFQRGTENYVAFLLVGLVVWRWFTSIINEGSNAIINSHHLFRQVYVPKYVFPSVTILTQTFKFSIVFVILLGFLWFSGYPLSLPYLALPVIFAVQLALVTGATYLLAALCPYLPDLRLLIDTGLRILFYFSGIFFDGASIPERFRPYFYLNPMAHLLEDYRGILMFGKWPPLEPLLWSSALGLAGILGGLILLKYNDKKYAKVVNR